MNFDPAALYPPPAVGPGEKTLNNSKDIRPENGSSQGHNLALTGLFEPSSHESGKVIPRTGASMPITVTRTTKGPEKSPLGPHGRECMLVMLVSIHRNRTFSPLQQESNVQPGTHLKTQKI